MEDGLTALSFDDRRVIASAWQGRAQGERTAAETFRVVADGLVELAAEPDLIALARRAIDDELATLSAAGRWPVATPVASSPSRER
jgi:hypothetical protein